MIVMFTSCVIHARLVQLILVYCRSFWRREQPFAKHLLGIDVIDEVVLVLVLMRLSFLI